MTNIKIITKKELLLNGMIPNQKKENETFESYINKVIENPNLQTQFLMSCIKELKQLHDKEIKRWESLFGKYLEVGEGGIMAVQSRWIRDDIHKIKELQAEIEFQRDLLSEPCNECKKRIEGSKL